MVLKTALFLTLGAFIAVLGLAYLPSTPLGHLGLFTWDADWYYSIAFHGYLSPVGALRPDKLSANVLYFPGYPMAARALWHATPLIGVRSALILVSLAATAFATTYLQLLLKEWGTPPQHRSLALTASLLHPAAFFFVVAYSESTFTAALLGLIYWSERAIRADKRKSSVYWVLATLHGAMLTATRLVGIVGLIYPLLRIRSKKQIAAAATVTALSALGALGFFAFCHLKFGRWDLYFFMQQAGQRNHANFLAPLDWRIYLPTFPQNLADLPAWLSTMTPMWFSAALIASAMLVAPAKSRPQNLALYAVAAGMYYLSLCGVHSSGLVGMFRYTLPSWLMLVLLAAPRMKDKAMAPKTRAVLWSVASALLAFQGWLAYRFTHWLWVS